MTPTVVPAHATAIDDCHQAIARGMAGVARGRIARMVSTTVRKSILDAAACADGNVKPFACPVDAGEESRFGKALSKFERSIASCRIDEGEAPGALANLRGGTATDAAGLTDCFTGLAKCLACYTSNTALGQNEDCAAMSGFPGCDGMLQARP